MDGLNLQLGKVEGDDICFTALFFHVGDVHSSINADGCKAGKRVRNKMMKSKKKGNGNCL